MKARSLGSLIVWLLLGWGLWARGGFTFAFLFTTYSFIVVCGFSIRWPGLAGVRASRTVLRSDGTEPRDGTFAAGEEAEVEVVLERPWALPIPWLVVRERIGDAEYDLFHGPWLGKTIRYRFTLPLPERGVFRFEPMELWAGDPFGIVTQRLTVRTGQREIAAAPKPRMYGYESESMMLSLGEGTRGLARPGGEERLDYRAYQEGDSLTRVMWKLAARTEEWFVRRWEAASAGEETAIFVDQRSLADSEAADRAAEAAAGVIAALGSHRRAFRLMVSGVEAAGWRRALAALQPGSSKMLDPSAAAGLEWGLPPGSSGAIVVCAGMTPELAERCCRWQAGGQDVLVLYVNASGAPLTEEWAAWLQRGGVRLIEVQPQGERVLAEGGAAYGTGKAVYSS